MSFSRLAFALAASVAVIPRAVLAAEPDPAPALTPALSPRPRLRPRPRLHPRPRLRLRPRPR